MAQLRVSELAAQRLREMAAEEGRTILVVVDRLVGIGVRREGSRAGRPAKADPPPVVVVSQEGNERYPWDEEGSAAAAGRVEPVVAVGAAVRGAASRLGRVSPAHPGPVESVGSEGVRPKGLSDKEWDIRRLKAQRAASRRIDDGI